MPPTSFFLPDRTPTHCVTCGVPGTKLYPLLLCPGCSTTAHCEKKCREKDPHHNSKVCVPRVHLELGEFYPFIAWAAELTRLQHIDIQPALWHKIVNVPDREITGNSHAPDGPPTCVIRYGRPMKDVPPLPPPDPNRQDRLLKRPESPPGYPPALVRWFSFCLSLNQRAYLRRRISRDGHLLPVVMGMGIAVLLELFSVTREFPVAPCLHYLGKPIWDFGIYRGAVCVNPQRVMSYVDDGSDEPPKQLQNPQNHFWLYFVTEDETEKLYLDVGLFVYGERYHVVDADLYLPLRDRKEALEILQRLLEVPSSAFEFLDPYAAAHFTDRSQRDKMTLKDSQIHYETNMFPMLRNKNLTEALEYGARRHWDNSTGRFPWRFTDGAVDALCEFMKEADQFTGSQTLGELDVEMMFLMDTINNGTRILRNALDGGKYKNMPCPCVERCKWELGVNPRKPDPRF